MLKWLSGILTTVLSGWILHDRLLHILRSWSWHFLNSDISQGNVVTQFRCDGIISQGFVANLLVNLSVKEVWKSVNIWRSYGQYCSALFFWLTVYIFSGGFCRLVEFCQVQTSLCVQVLPYPILAALLHGSRPVGVSQTAAWYKKSNYGTFAEGATYIRLGGHQVGHRPTF